MTTEIRLYASSTKNSNTTTVCQITASMSSIYYSLLKEREKSNTGFWGFFGPVKYHKSSL